MNDGERLKKEHKELCDLWQLYRIYSEKPVKDDAYWQDVAVSFSSKGVVKTDFGSELAQFFMFRLDRQYGGLINADNGLTT